MACARDVLVLAMITATAAAPVAAEMTNSKIEIMAGMKNMSSVCSEFFQDRAEVLQAMANTADSVSAWENAASAEEVARFNEYLEEEKAKEEQPNSMACAIAGMYFLGFSTALSIEE